MPSFYLQFEEACRTFQTAAEHSGEHEALADSWRVFRKIAVHLESGTSDRIENLARRLGHLQRAKRGVLTLQKIRDQNIHRSFDSSSRANSAPRTSDPAKATTPQRNSRSSRVSPEISLQKVSSLPSCHAPLVQFSGLDPTSLLCTSQDLSSKPIVHISLDIEHSPLPAPVPTSRAWTNPAFTTFYDNPNDPNELCILPSPLSAPPFSLHSIPELADDELEHGPLTPRASSPVLFVNPFGQPYRKEHQQRQQQLPSPPQTPSASASECIPPHLNDDEEDEDTLSRSEPINLTGRIKKLMDPPIALGGTSDIFYGEWRLPVPKRVAVKVLRTTSTNSVTAVQRRLRREMRLWWMCRHRNVVPLYGYASDFGGMDAMVSPVGRIVIHFGWAGFDERSVDEEWVGAYSYQSPQMLVGGKAEIDIVAGLKYLHHFQPPIIHGDLKPTNVLISDNGDACLCDFGLSRIIKSEAGPSGFTTSNFAGSIRYMSPELLNSEDEESMPLVTAASDVYALGCVGLEIVTDHTPYANRNLDAQVMHDIIRGIPPARRPSLVHATASASSTGRPSLPKFWDLMTATWAVEPHHRPDIVRVGWLLAECRTTGHVGPQLRSTTAVMGMGMQHVGGNVGSSQVRVTAEHGLSANHHHHHHHVTTSVGFVQRSSSFTSRRLSSPRSSSSSASPSSSSSGGTLLGRGSSLRGRQDGANIFRALGVVGGGGVGSGVVVVGSASFAQTTFVTKRSVSAGPAASPASPTSLPSPSPSPSHFPAHSQHAIGPVMASDTLHRLRRSTSAVLRGSLRKIPVSGSGGVGMSFRPSLDAAEQVWHDA